MRYLRSINEMYFPNIKEYCELNLAYLLDDSRFAITFNENKTSNTIGLYIEGPNRTSPFLVHTSEYFLWDDIKDIFIPFIQRFIKDYPNLLIGINFLIDDYSRWTNYYVEDININRILEDSFLSRSLIDNIQIIINK